MNEKGFRPPMLTYRPSCSSLVRRPLPGMLWETNRRNLGPYSRSLRISRDGHLDQSGADDIS